MFVPAMLVVSLLATCLFGLVGAESLLDPLPLERAALIRHALLGGAACLLLVLSQTWFAIYLASVGRALRRLGSGASSEPVPEWQSATTAARRGALPWTLAVPLSALVVFLIGGGVFSGFFTKTTHGIAFGVSLLVQLAALWLEGRSLLRHEAAFSRADASTGVR